MWLELYQCHCVLTAGTLPSFTTLKMMQYDFPGEKKIFPYPEGGGNGFLPNTDTPVLVTC